MMAATNSRKVEPTFAIRNKKKILKNDLALGQMATTAVCGRPIGLTALKMMIYCSKKNSVNLLLTTDCSECTDKARTLSLSGTILKSFSSLGFFSGSHVRLDDMIQNKHEK